MVDRQVRLTDQGMLVGILTERDVFDAFRAAGEEPVSPELYLG